MQISSFVAGLFFLTVGPAFASTNPTQQLSKMSIEQKVGQMMIWSFAGTQFSSQTKNLLKSYQPGALIVFRRNIKTNDDIAAFNFEAQNFAKTNLSAPLFLMIDQEGGVVSRIKTETPSPSALALGRTHDPAFISSFARSKAEVLQSLGFNVNLAPVLDISNPAKDSFIGNRTFGDDPRDVSEMGFAYSLGLSEAGILPTAKHFPGHGGTLQDSHMMTPKKFSTIEDLEKRDLIPFRKFAGGNFSRMVMMAHLSLPNIDPTGVPATFSKVIIQDHLRQRIGFNGLVITDDLEMGGALISKNIGERAIRAILAGNDMVMLAGSFWNQKSAFRAVVQAVRSGRIPVSRLNESVLRILEAKGNMSTAAFKPDRKRSTAALQQLEDLSRTVMKKNFEYALETLTEPWPLVDTETKVLVVGSSYGFFNAFKDNFPGRSRFYFLSPSTLTGAGLEMMKTRADFIVFYASGSTTARWLSQLPAEVSAKTIVVNCNHPGEISIQRRFLSVLNMNSHSPESGQWLAEALKQPPELRAPAADPEIVPEVDEETDLDGLEILIPEEPQILESN